MKFSALLIATVSCVRIEQASADEPWWTAQANKNIKKTGNIAAWRESERVAAVNAQAKDDAWRATGPVTPWGKLGYAQRDAERDWQDWQTKEFNNQHKYTNGVADDAEKRRVAAVNAQAKEDAWRNNGPKTAWGKLGYAQKSADRDWQDWQTKEFNAQNGHTLGVAADAEKQRVASIKDQAKSDAWRNNGPKTQWGKLGYAQREANRDWQPWQTAEFTDQHAHTLGVAADSEKQRVAAVREQAADDEWRGEGKKTPWGQLGYAQRDAQRDWQDWQTDEFKSQHGYTTGVAKEAEKRRVEAVDAQARSDEWRGEGKKTPWGQLGYAQRDAQRDWQDWQTNEFNNQHKYTMGVADQSEKERVAAVKAQAKEDAWRNNGPKTAWGVLAQGDDEPAPWYQRQADKLHAKTMTEAGDVDTISKTGVSNQKASDVWRGKGPVTEWEASNPQGWNAAAVKAESKAPAVAPEVAAKAAAAAPAAPAEVAAPAASAEVAAPVAPADAAAPAK